MPNPTATTSQCGVTEYKSFTNACEDESRSANGIISGFKAIRNPIIYKFFITKERAVNPLRSKSENYPNTDPRQQQCVIFVLAIRKKRAP